MAPRARQEPPVLHGCFLAPSANRAVVHIREIVFSFELCGIIVEVKYD